MKPEDSINSLSVSENTLRHQVLGNIDRISNDITELLDFLVLDDNERIKLLMDCGQLILGDNYETIRAYEMFKLKALKDSFESFIKKPIRESIGRISTTRKALAAHNKE